MNNILLFVITGYISVVLQKAILLNVVNARWTIKRLFATVSIIYIPHVAIFTFITPENMVATISILAWIIISILAYRLSFKQSWQKSMFMVAGQYFFLSTGINYVFLTIIHHLPDTARLFLMQYFFISRIVVIGIYTLVLIFTRKYATRGYSSLDHLISKYWKFYLAFFLLYMTYDMLHKFYWSGVQYVDSLTGMFAIALFVLFFLHSLYHVRTDHRLVYTQRELEILRTYTESQRNTLNDLRGFKHDYNNTLRTMQGLTENKNFDQLESLIKSIAEQLKSPQTVEISDISKKIPLLSGILSEKIARAEVKGITFNISLPEQDIDLKYFTDLDYSRIVGILLDNALEASEASKDKTIELSISHENDNLHTLVKNSCDIQVDIHRIFEQGYSTKPVPSGDGLHQVNLIKERYQKIGCPIELTTVSENGYFAQTLVI